MNPSSSTWYASAMYKVGRSLVLVSVCAAIVLEGRLFSQSPTASTVPVTPSAHSKDATPPTPTDNIRYGYLVHQSVDFGGHIVSQSGSGAMYDTLVNTQTGPRILNFSLEMRTADPRHSPLFDHLSTNSFGYGGDANSVTLLNVAKGKLYDLHGSFRRDRQYFDYNLLDNPLIPPASTPYVALLDSPHLFNTVRRNSDLALILAPLARFSVRLGYNRNTSEGPSYSTVHYGADALLMQFWRNGTEIWDAGLDYKPNRQTTINYDQFVMHYKNDTSWQLAGLNYQLSNGTPVALGVDLSSVWVAPCAAPFAANGTVKATCNAFLGYSRSAPTRTLAPTEQVRFQSASISRLTLNGRGLYSATTSNLDHFNEVFDGLETRTALRGSVITGAARVRRINVNGDLGATLQITPKITASNLFNFWDFRIPGVNSFTETDYAGSSLLTPPGAAKTTATTDAQFLNQKTKTNTFTVQWATTSALQLSAGYRYRSRIITDAGGDFIPIHENWGLFGAAFRPTPKLRVNFNVEEMYADRSFTRISPRQLQHYIVRTTYRPQVWLTFAGTVNIRESRNNVDTVNHLEHNRDFSFGAAIARSERWSLDLNYSYDDVFSSTLECYVSTPAPPTAGVAPAVCIAAGTPLLNSGYYNAPTQFGSLGFTVSPVKRTHFTGGYRTTSVNGRADTMNIRQVPGSLQSQFQTPYASFAIDIAPNWSWKGDYNYYGYGEGGAVGPTFPRSFHGNVTTLAVHYAF